ncbi:MAG: hypothetical protein KGJ23_05140 [Euryarchaeota archaeon]|nr:hypothetical protein [Euryarchaeota archaeon]MDE2046024.1 hypothetical protein [Thermoplasmata archaeon]
MSASPPGGGGRPLVPARERPARRRSQGLLTELVPATVRDVLWAFALAEAQNDERHDRCYSKGLGEVLFQRVRGGDRNSLSAGDWKTLRSTVVGTRPGYLPQLFSLGLRWYSGKIETSKLGALQTPDLNIFRPLAPSRTVEEFSATLERGARTPGTSVGENYRRMRGTFDYPRMLGSPVVIGERRAGPFTFVEGATRLSILCAKARAGERVPARVTVMAGIGRLAKEWEFY